MYQKTPSNRSSAKLSQDEIQALIRKRAQEIYEKRGRTPGKDVENWVEAEKQIKRELKIS